MSAKDKNSAVVFTLKKQFRREAFEREKIVSSESKCDVSREQTETDIQAKLI